MAVGWRSRGSQRFAGLWSLFLLVQQFHVVMLQASSRDRQIHSDKDFSGYTTKANDEDYPALVFSDKVSNASHSYEYSTEDMNINASSTSADISSSSAEDFGKTQLHHGNKNLDNETMVNNTFSCPTDLLRLTADISEVLLKQYGEMVNATSRWLNSCNSSAEKIVQEFWKEQPLFGSLYSIISVLFYSVLNCTDMANLRMQEAEDDLGCELAVNMLQMISYMLNDSSSDENTTEEQSSFYQQAELLDDEKTFVAMQEKFKLLFQNVLNLGEVLKLSKSLFVATDETEKMELENAIFSLINNTKEYLNQEESQEPHMHKVKRDTESIQEETPQPCYSCNSFPSITPDAIGFNGTFGLPFPPVTSQGVLRHGYQWTFRSNASAWFPSSSQSNSQGWDQHGTVLNRRKRDMQMKTSHTGSIGGGQNVKFVFRRQHIRTVSSEHQLYFIKSLKDCKLLTSLDNASELVESAYNEDETENQLWRWENETTLRNQATGATLPLGEIKCSRIKFSPPILGTSQYSAPCTSKDGSDFLVNSEDCMLDFKVGPLSEGKWSNATHTTPSWQLIPKQDNDDNIQSVLCPFFVKVNTFPCVLLTGGEEGDHVQAKPFEEYAVETQLWYWSGEHLLNFYSGLALEVIEGGPNGSELLVISTHPKDAQDKDVSAQLWVRDGPLIRSVMYPNLSLDLTVNDRAGNYLVHVSDSHNRTWSLLSAHEESSVINVTTCVQVFFLKNKGIPCKILTVQDMEVHPEFHYYDDNLILRQLWFWRGGSLINVATEFVLGIKEGQNASGTDVTLISLDSSTHSHKWEVEGSLIRSQQHPTCLLYASNTSDSYMPVLQCIDESEDQLHEWEYVPFGSGFSTMEQVTCLYFIKSTQHPCEVLTSFPDERVVKLRPAVEELMQGQLWYWNGQFLMSADNDLVLATVEDGTSAVRLALEELSSEKRQQQWTNTQSQIISVYLNDSAVTLNETDGLITLQSSSSGFMQKWEFVESNQASQNPDSLKCSVSREGTQTHFFVRNRNTPCLLLTAGVKGGSPELRNYDSNAAQLWYWDRDHLVNVQTGLALIINPTNQSGVSPTILWHMFSYDNDQKWLLHDGALKPKLNSNCSITIETDSKGTTSLQKSCFGQPNAGEWEMIDLERTLKDGENLVCFFFIQSKQSPCELLTGYTENKAVNVRPAVEELIDSQLWYWNGQHLIHAKTGMGLAVVSNKNQNMEVTLVNMTALKDNETWVRDGYHIHLYSQNSSLLSLIVENDGMVQIMSPESRFSQEWDFIKKEDAMDNTDQLHCREKQDDRSMFFIKNSAQPCKILTATKKGENPHFEHFSEDNVAMQLWTWNGNQLINMGSGFALQLNQKQNSAASVSLWPTYSYATNQKWKKHGNTLKSLQNECFLTARSVHDDLKLAYLSCEKHQSLPEQSWTFVNYEELSKSLDAVVCFYFIRNQHESCEYLTGFSQENSVLVRPVIEELLEHQLWYWDGPYLTNLKSGLILTANDLVSRGSVVLKAKGTPSSLNETQQWLILGNAIKPLNTEQFSLDVDVEDDGKVLMKEWTDAVTQQWTMLAMNDSQQNVESLSCALFPSDPDMFFIKHSEKPCMLLSAGEKGHSPQFQLYDEDNLAFQLWYWDRHHLINIGTGLALQQAVTQQHQSPVVLWPIYAFANGQQWTQEGKALKLLKNPTCVLQSSPESVDKSSLSIDCSDGKSTTQSWTTVPLDEKDFNWDQVVCDFFIKNAKEPCDLLTGFSKAEPPKVTPLESELMSNQLWHWDGQRIVNSGSGLLLNIALGGSVVLSDKRSHWKSESWEVHGQYIQSVAKKGSVLSLQRSNAVLSSPDNRDFQKWYLIPKKMGLENPGSLHCQPNHTNVVTYLVKNERHPCYLLTQIECGQVGLHSYTADQVTNQIWFWEQHHLLSANNSLALSLKNPDIEGATLVALKYKYSYEDFQMWERDGHLIRSLLRSKRSVLGFSGELLQLQDPDGTYGQQWTWLFPEDVRKDTKLVERCSRCYDKAEETASEVIGFIPFISLVYNLVRSAVYGGKGCPEVAVESLTNAAVDVLIDAAVAAAVALTGGAASAAAFGIKSGVKFGAKAGLKAFGKAVKATVKVNMHLLKIGFKTVAKQGVKKTLKTSMISTFKRTYKTVRSTVRTIKHVTVKSGKVVKKIAVKSYSIGKNMKEQIRKVSFKKALTASKVQTSKNGKKMTINVGRSIQAKTKAMSHKLKEMGNKLAAKAEKRVKQLEEIQTAKGKIVKRCRRMIDGCVFEMKSKKVDHDLNYIKDKFFQGKDEISREYIYSYYRNLNKETLKINVGDKIIDNNYPDYNKIVSYFEDMKREIGDIPVQHSYVYKKVDNKLEKIDDSILDKNNKITINGKEVQCHTEVCLSLKIGDKAVADAEDIFWYTKNSPCMTPSTSDGKSCMLVILERCKNWFNNKLGKCYIKFDEWWGFDGKTYDQFILKEHVIQNQNFKVNNFQTHFEIFLSKQREQLNSKMTSANMRLINSLRTKLNLENVPKRMLSEVEKQSLRTETSNAVKLFFDNIHVPPESVYSDYFKVYNDVVNILPKGFQDACSRNWNEILNKALSEDQNIQSLSKSLREKIVLDSLAKEDFLEQGYEKYLKFLLPQD